MTSVLEAGPRDWSWTVHMPVALMYNLVPQPSKFNWSFHSVPQKHLNNRSIYCPRGKGEKSNRENRKHGNFDLNWYPKKED